MTAPSSTTWTFLFSDIEGSTRLLQAAGADYAALLEQHRRLIGRAVESHGGRTFGSEGDALFVVFPSAVAAVLAAADAQRALADHQWPHGREIRVRMGIHSGEAMALGDNFVGLPLHQVARVMNAAHGGQVLVTGTTRALAATLPDELELRDLGEHRLKDLALPERLYQLAGPGLAASFAPPRTLSERPNNLPLQLTSFVGREELAGARRALDATRLLTLTGPGGTGKTRLALQLAADASDEFTDGVYFVPLESVRDPEQVVSAIAATLGVADAPGVAPSDRLVDYLNGKRALLVLDNFEQVVDAGPAVARLLREVAELKVIVTSRIVLRVSGEHEFPVPPLGLPGTAESVTADDAMRYEAVRLFVERAMSVQPSFTLSDETAPGVVDIVRQLDGLPLAIELAAARTRIMSVPQIRSRLGQRLGLLTGGARDLPGRQQTLRGAIEWSYELLDEPERRLFARFAVFVGGAALPQADSVCQGWDELGRDTLDGLGSLADKSLVRAALTDEEDPRFAMLMTIREYALERATATAEWAQVRRRHALAYVALAEDVAPRLKDRQRGRWLDRLEHDHENIVAALDWAVPNREAEIAIRLVVSTWRYWQARGHLYLGREQVDRVTAMPEFEAQPALLRAQALGAAGGITYWQGDFSETHRRYAAALEQARASGDRRALAEALYNFGFAPMSDQSADYATYYRAGQPSLEESLELYRELGDERGMADAHWALAMAAAANRDVGAAIEHGERSHGLYGALGDAFGRAWAAHQLALYVVMDGRTDDALPLAVEALTHFVEAGDQSGIQLGLVDFAWLAGRWGQTERAWRLGGAAEEVRVATGIWLDEASYSFLDWQPPQKPETDPDAMRIWNEGRQMSLDDAVRLALETRRDG